MIEGVQQNYQHLPKYWELCTTLLNQLGVQKFLRMKGIMPRISPFFYMEAKFGPLEKEIKSDWHQSR